MQIKRFKLFRKRLCRRLWCVGRTAVVLFTACVSAVEQWIHPQFSQCLCARCLRLALHHLQGGAPGFLKEKQTKHFSQKRSNSDFSTVKQMNAGFNPLHQSVCSTVRAVSIWTSNTSHFLFSVCSPSQWLKQLRCDQSAALKLHFYSYFYRLLMSANSVQHRHEHYLLHLEGFGPRCLDVHLPTHLWKQHIRV